MYCGADLISFLIGLTVGFVLGKWWYIEKPRKHEQNE